MVIADRDVIDGASEGPGSDFEGLCPSFGGCICGGDDGELSATVLLEPISCQGTCGPVIVGNDVVYSLMVDCLAEDLDTGDAPGKFVYFRWRLCAPDKESDALL